MSDLLKPILVLLVLGAFAYMLFRESSRSDAVRRIRFAERPTMSESNFLAQCNVSSDQDVKLALDLRRRIASTLEIPVEKIIPNDRFDQELKAPPGWEFDDGVNLLMVELHEAFRAKHLAANLSEVRSVRDYVAAWIHVEMAK